MATVQDTFLAELDATSRRYAARVDERERVKSDLATRGILYTDAPDRVSRRLDRLNVDWTLASAIRAMPEGATTGRSLGTAIPAEHFGANILGLERIMGRSDLIDVGFLEAGYRASRSVGRVVVRGADGHVGTGFLVAPRLLLTNNHVLSGVAEAARAHVEFDFQAGLDGRPLSPVAFDLEPQTFFHTEVELDFALVAVAPTTTSGRALGEFGFLPLDARTGKILLGEKVNIIQHPNGEPKQLALRENELVDLLDDFLHYETDTSPGSSGSPVFNDQWEVVALHHSGVPGKDAEGNILATDGSPWTPAMGEHAIAWKANEGVRISRVLQAIREAPITGPAAELRAELFAPAPQTPSSPPAPERAVAAPPGGTGLGIGKASGTFSVPLVISVSIGEAPHVSATAGAPVAPAAAAVAADEADEELTAALVDVEAGRSRVYYDAEADAAARETYYAHVQASSYEALHGLVQRTHLREPRYRPARLVYPWVDLHPDKQLRSIYSGKTFAPEELIREDLAIERRLERLRRERGPAAVALEAASPFNCEHVVPQSWFDKREPMRGDLHHLFACESGCNSFRGNFPYFDFPDFEEKLRDACGLREDVGFEPSSGKGPVARATLYFLLRYPALVGDMERELSADRLELLLDWHEQHEVDEYERHRNAAIAEIQGNRNPLVDHPGWAREIDWAPAWGRSA
jgi:endonuclease I/V8-like Glu-specific endopeptidase